jgi:hypothetical protein
LNAIWTRWWSLHGLIRIQGIDVGRVGHRIRDLAINGIRLLSEDGVTGSNNCDRQKQSNSGKQTA